MNHSQLHVLQSLSGVHQWEREKSNNSVIITLLTWTRSQSRTELVKIFYSLMNHLIFALQTSKIMATNNSSFDFPSGRTKTNRVQSFPPVPNQIERTTVHFRFHIVPYRIRAPRIPQPSALGMFKGVQSRNAPLLTCR